MIDLKRDAYVIIDSDTEVIDGYINVVLNRPIPSEIIPSLRAYYIYCFYQGRYGWTHSRPRVKHVVGSMIELGWGVPSSPVGCILRVPDDMPDLSDQALKRFEQELSSRKYAKTLTRILRKYRANENLTISFDEQQYIHPMFWGNIY